MLERMNRLGLVMRFDDVSTPASPKPLATWVNWGQHPESLDSYNLITADYLSALQRDVDRATGSTTSPAASPRSS